MSMSMSVRMPVGVGVTMVSVHGRHSGNIGYIRQTVGRACAKGLAASWAEAPEPVGSMWRVGRVGVCAGVLVVLGVHGERKGMYRRDRR